MKRRILVRGLAALPLIIPFAARARNGLPTVGYVTGGTKGNALDVLYRESMIYSGALMTYGPSVSWCYQRVGYYAARVLGGAKAADLPIKQSSRYELVLNTKTAKALGQKIPHSIALRVDRAVE